MRRRDVTFKERLLERRAYGVVPFSAVALRYVLLAALGILSTSYLAIRIFDGTGFIWKSTFAGLSSEQGLKDLKSWLLPCIFIPLLVSIFVTLLFIVLQTKFFMTFQIDNWRRASRRSKRRNFVGTVASLLFAAALACFASVHLFKSIMPLFWADYSKSVATSALFVFSASTLGMVGVLIISSILLIFIKRVYTAYEKTDRLH